MLVKTTFSKIVILAIVDISASRMPNSRTRNLQNSRFVWVLDSFHWGILTGVFFLSFQSRGFSVAIVFFAGDGYADSHISTASTSHRGEDLCSLLQCPPHPTPSCIQRSNTTRHLCSVATCSGRSTRNVNMAPPTPPRPFMTCEHTLAKTRVLRERERGMLGWSSVGLQGGPMVDSLVDSQDVTLGENWGRYHHVPPKIRC